MIGTILYVFIVFCIAGVICWVFNQFVPVPPVFKQLFTGFVVLLLLIWLLGFFGVVGHWGYAGRP